MNSITNLLSGLWSFLKSILRGLPEAVAVLIAAVIVIRIAAYVIDMVFPGRQLGTRVKNLATVYPVGTSAPVAAIVTK